MVESLLSDSPEHQSTSLLYCPHRITTDGALRTRNNSLASNAHFEKVLLPEQETFLLRCDDYPWARSVWNFHPEFEIHLIRRSSGTAFIGDYIGDFHPGDLTAVAGGLPHDWATLIQPGEVVRERDLVVQFDAEKLRSAKPWFPELRLLDPFISLARRGLLYRGTTARQGAELLETMRAAHGLERLVLFLRLLDKLATSGEHTILSAQEVMPTADLRTLTIMQKAIRCITEKISSELKLADVADLVGLSESSFSRFFKKSTGRSFSNYVTGVRIGRACRLLAETGMPVSAICYEVGYRNLSNFNKSFLRQRGLTPSKYRSCALHRAIDHNLRLGASAARPAAAGTVDR